MTRKLCLGLLTAAFGAAGLAAVVLVVYRLDEHNRQAVALGMPGDLLFALGCLLTLLGGIGLIFEAGRPPR